MGVQNKKNGKFSDWLRARFLAPWPSSPSAFSCRTTARPLSPLSLSLSLSLSFSPPSFSPFSRSSRVYFENRFRGPQSVRGCGGEVEQNFFCNDQKIVFFKQNRKTFFRFFLNFPPKRAMATKRRLNVGVVILVAAVVNVAVADPGERFFRSHQSQTNEEPSVLDGSTGPG